MYLLEKTTNPKVLKLGLYLPWLNIHRFEVVKLIYTIVYYILIYTNNLSDLPGKDRRSRMGMWGFGNFTFFGFYKP